MHAVIEAIFAAYQAADSASDDASLSAADRDTADTAAVLAMQGMAVCGAVLVERNGGMAREMDDGV